MNVPKNVLPTHNGIPLNHERNQIMIPHIATAWMNIKNTTLKEARYKRMDILWFHSYKYIRNQNLFQKQSKLEVVLERGDSNIDNNSHNRYRISHEDSHLLNNRTHVQPSSCETILVNSMTKWPHKHHNVIAQHFTHLWQHLCKSTHPPHCQLHKRIIHTLLMFLFLECTPST